MSEKEANEHVVQDKEIQLQSALDRVSQQDSASVVNDAHLWWSYIWHAMKQEQEHTAGIPAASTSSSSSQYIGAAAGVSSMVQGSNFLSEIGHGSGSTGALVGSAHPGNVEFKPSSDAATAVHESRLKDNLRSQAIEITKLRQVCVNEA